MNLEKSQASDNEILKQRWGSLGAAVTKYKTGRLEQQIVIFSQFWGLEVHNQSASKFGFW